MQFYPFTVAVGDRFKLEATANFLRYYDNTAGAASPTIKVSCLGTDGQEFLLRPGEQIKMPRSKEGFLIENFDAALTISGRILAGEGDFDGATTITGNITSLATIVGATAIANYNLTIGTIESVAIVASSNFKGQWLRADPANTSDIALGGTGVTLATAPILLSPGEKMFIPAGSCGGALFAIAGSASQKLYACGSA